MDEETPILSDDLSATLERGDGSEIVTFRLPTLIGSYRLNAGVLRAAGIGPDGPERTPDGYDVLSAYVSIVAQLWDGPEVVYPLVGEGDPIPVAFPRLSEYGGDLVAHGEACFDALHGLGFGDLDVLGHLGEALYRRTMIRVRDERARVEAARADFS